MIKKRILTALLCAALALSCLPAFAEESALDQAMKRASSGDIAGAIALSREGLYQEPIRACESLQYYYGLDGASQDLTMSLIYGAYAAGMGSGRGAAGVAAAFCSGVGVEKDDREAIYWLEKSIELGYAHSHIHLGAHYRDGQGVEADYVRAEEQMLRGLELAENDETRAYAHRELGKLYSASENPALNPELAAQHYEQAGQLGHPAAPEEMARFWYGLKNWQKAADSYEQAALEGSVSAMEWLGFLYSMDETGIRSDKKSAQWYEEAVKGGSVYSLIPLAGLYANGQGVKQDVSRALSLYAQAVDAGDPSGAYLAGELYYSEEYGVTDREKAVALFEAYISSGDPLYLSQSMLLCGWCCYHDLDRKEQGLAYLKSAADMGDVTAMYYYAYTLETGENDREAALPWYQQAADAGHPDAAEKLR